jgi:hypothetical protein
MKDLQLSQEHLLVLQQVSEYGGDDIKSLSAGLRLGRQRLAVIIADLRRQGLVRAQNSWISLSSRGRRVMTYIWPEAIQMAY